MSSRQHRQSQEQASSSQQSGQQLSHRSPAPQRREGLLGWFQDTGDWVADQYDSTSTAVSEWAGGVYESAENAVDAVSETVSDAKDIWDSTSISKKDGIWNVKTDLDEIADLVPLDMIDLDREGSDNQVTMQIDHQKGEVRLQTNSVAVSQLNVAGMSINSARLNNIEIVVKNAQVNIPIIGDVSVGSSESNAKKSATISIGSVTGMNASYGEGNEAIKASQIELRNVQIDSEMGGESFGMQPQNARFSVGEARVVGLDSSTISGDISVSDANASIDQTTNSADFSASSVLGSNISSDGLAIENTSLQGLQGNIAPGANGHSANISARQASISGIDVGDMNNSESSGNNLDVNLSLGQANINDLDTEHVDANNLNLTGAHFSSNANGMQASATNISASGLDTEWVDANQMSLSNLNYTQGADNLNLSASGGTVSGLDTEVLDTESLQIGKTNIGYSEKQGANIALANANVKGVTGSVNASSLSLNNLNSNIGSDGSSNLSVEQFSAKDIQEQGHQLGQLTGSSISANTNGNGDASASIANLSYQNYQGNRGTSAAGTLNNLSASGNLNTQDGNASLSSADIGATNILGNQLQSARLQDLTVGRSNGENSANIASVSAQGLQTQHGSANSLNATNLSAKQGDELSGSLEQLKINSVSGFGSSAEQITLNQLSGKADANLENGQFSLQNANIQNASSGTGSVEALNVNSIQGTKQGQNLNASLSDLEMLNPELSGISSAQSIKASGLSLQSNGSNHQANMNSMTASNIQEHNFGATVEQANLNNVGVSGTGLENVDIAIGSGDINQAAMQGATLENGSITNANAQFRNGQGSGTLDSIDFQNARYFDVFSAQSGQARNISASGNLQQQQGTVDSVRLDGINTNLPQMRGNLDSASMYGGSFNHTGSGRGTASVENLQASNGSFDLQHSESTGQSFNQNSSAAKVNIDTNKLLETGAQRIDSGSINASANMIPGQYGDGLAGFQVKDGTQMDANVLIRNNQIQNGSKIGTNRSIDTALWTSTDGVYVKDDKMMAAVNGWFDINASERANDATGLDGKELHSIADYASAVANMPPSENSDSSSIGNPIDLNSMQANGHVGLSDGRIDAGDASVTLAGASQGANQMAFEANANRISMAFAQLLSSSLAIKTDQGQVQTGEASIEGGEVDLKPNDMTASGSIERVSIDSVNLSR